MCIGSSPSAPEAPAIIPETAELPVAADGTTTSERDSKRRRAASGEGRSTILTSSTGVTSSAPTSQKTLLGS